MRNSQWNLPLVSKPEFRVEEILRTHPDHLHTYSHILWNRIYFIYAKIDGFFPIFAQKITFHRDILSEI